MWRWLCKCLQPQTRCAQVLRARAWFPEDWRFLYRFPTDPHDGCGIVHIAWKSLKLSNSWGFPRSICKWKFQVKSREDSCFLEPGTLSPTGPFAMRLVPCSAERMRNSMYPLLSWIFLILTHKSPLTLYQETIFLSFHPLQYGPINILVLYFQPWLCNTDHSWLVWISPELPRMLLKAQEEQKCFNQLNQSNKKK